MTKSISIAEALEFIKENSVETVFEPVVSSNNYWWGFAHDNSLIHWNEKRKSSLYQITSDRDGGAVAYTHNRELAEKITFLLNEEDTDNDSH